MHSLSTHQQLFKQRRFRLLFVLFIVVSLLLGVAVVPLEKSVGNITTISDGLWWAVSTVTTVGYGDRVPVTNEGRLIGVVLQIVGAMMFGVVIAIISHYFSRVQDEFYWNRLFERLDRLEGGIDEVQKRTGFIVKSGEKSDGEARDNEGQSDVRTPKHDKISSPFGPPPGYRRVIRGVMNAHPL